MVYDDRTFVEKILKGQMKDFETVKKTTEKQRRRRARQNAFCDHPRNLAKDDGCPMVISRGLHPPAIQKLELNDGDVVVYRVKDKISQANADDIINKLKTVIDKIAKDCRVVVVDGGAEINILTGPSGGYGEETAGAGTKEGNNARLFWVLLAV